MAVQFLGPLFSAQFHRPFACCIVAADFYYGTQAGLEVAMSDVKQQMTQIIDEQPDDSTFEEILRELALARMIKRGLDDSDAARTIKNDDLKQQMSRWRR